jgi:hypothetical protein
MDAQTANRFAARREAEQNAQAGIYARRTFARGDVVVIKVGATAHLGRVTSQSGDTVYVDTSGDWANPRIHVRDASEVASEAEMSGKNV